MSINQMREYVIDQYRGSLTWPARVKKMSDNQVIAIYYKMRGQRSLHSTRRKADGICFSP